MQKTRNKTNLTISINHWVSWKTRHYLIKAHTKVSVEKLHCKNSVTLLNSRSANRTKPKNDMLLLFFIRRYVALGLLFCTSASMTEYRMIANTEIDGEKYALLTKSNEPLHEISNNVVCATSKASDQPAHTRSMIRTFASRLNILWVLSYWPYRISSF